MFKHIGTVNKFAKHILASSPGAEGLTAMAWDNAESCKNALSMGVSLIEAVAGLSQKKAVCGTKMVSKTYPLSYVNYQLRFQQNRY